MPERNASGPERNPNHGVGTLPTHVYQSPRDAVLGLVRIFAPCHYSIIAVELRSLLRARAIAEIPPTWLMAKKGFVAHEVKAILEELWLAGLIKQRDNQMWMAD